MNVPAPLRWVERRPKSSLHDPRLAALVGISLGVAFTVCFATGLISHLIQQPPSWFDWPTRPAGFYRISQGVHVVTGFASIPLLLAKLWIVYPKLFEWPPVASVANAIERLSLVPLIAGGLFMVLSGTANVARWYPWSFFFTSAHYWVGWVTFGSMVMHLGAKWTLVREHTGRARTTANPAAPADPTDPTDPAAPAGAAAAVDLERERRRFLAGLAATGGFVVAAVAGNTVGPLSRIAVLAQRRPGTGPQGMPVNKSARGAGVAGIVDSPDYRLIVEGRVGRRLELTIDDLRAMPQRTAELPIACVEGWSTSGTWRGVPLRDLLRAAEAAEDGSVSVESFQRGGLYRRSDVDADQAADRDMLLALGLNGSPLHPDHGYPVRLIGPNRPGVMQTKWVERLVVS